MSDDITKIVFGDPNDPLAELAVCEQNATSAYESLSLTPSLQSRLSGFMQFAPSIAGGVSQAVRQTYTLTFKQTTPRLMQAAGGGFHATAVDRAGKIVGNGVLNPVTAARVLASAAAAWQIMAVVTAQVHLTEINARLVEIERGVSEIKAWLETDKIATLVNAQRYVAEIRDAFAMRGLTEHDVAGFEHQLERLWLDCGQVSTALRLMLEDQTKRFEQLQLGSLWGLSSQVKVAKSTMNQYERLSRAFLLAMQTRAVLVQGRAALPLSREVAVQRLGMLRDELNQFDVTRQQFFEEARQQVRTQLRATLHVGTSDNTYQSKVLGATQVTSAKVLKQTAAVAASINTIEAGLDTQQQIAEHPVTFLITLDDQGNLAEVCRLLKG